MNYETMTADECDLEIARRQRDAKARSVKEAIGAVVVVVLGMMLAAGFVIATPEQMSAEFEYAESMEVGND